MALHALIYSNPEPMEALIKLIFAETEKSLESLDSLGA